MKEPQPAEFPLKEQTHLHPTSAYYILAKSGSSSKIAIHKHSAPNFRLETIPTIKTAKKSSAIPVTDAATPAKLMQSLSRSVRTIGAAERLVVEISGSLLFLGQLTLTFPHGLPHPSHEIELRLTGMGRQADLSVKESVLYFWDMSDSSAALELSMIVSGLRLEIAKV